MTKKKAVFLANVFKNDWVITLTATLIGVFLALYLNEWLANRKLNQQKEIATENILLEIAQNLKSVKQNLRAHEEILGLIDFSNRVNQHKEDGFVMHTDSLQVFRNKYPGLLTVLDSVPLVNGEYYYRAEANVNFQFPKINITLLAWDTLKNSGLNSLFDFNCLKQLQQIQNLTNAYFEVEKRIFDFVIEYEETENDVPIEKIRSDLDLIVDYEKMLIQGYEASQKALKAHM